MLTAGMRQDGQSDLVPPGYFLPWEMLAYSVGCSESGMVQLVLENGVGHDL